MDDAVVAVYLLLFTVTGVAMLLYYRRIREGSREYSASKTALEDIVLSFNRELEGQTERIKSLEERSKEARVENLQVLDKLRSEVAEVKSKVEDLAHSKQRLMENHETLRRRVEDLVLGRTEVPDVGMVDSLIRGREVSPIPPEHPSSFIKRDRALAPLTQTELRVLELLAAEGEKTAPQVRRVINLTREHTARLMKKLYVSGYVERRTTNVPYTYRLKKEMRELLRAGNGI